MYGWGLRECAGEGGVAHVGGGNRFMTKASDQVIDHSAGCRDEGAEPNNGRQGRAGSRWAAGHGDDVDRIRPG
jgi:hypothetical protein